MVRYFVFGGTNIDMQAIIAGKVRPYESNPSKISVTFGGVGRNIARSIANSEPCYFISAFSNSPLFLPLIEDLKNHHIDLSYSKIFNDQGSSIYLDLIDQDGVVVGASDTGLVERLNPEDFRSVCNLTSDNDIIVLDTNLNHESLEYILTHSKGYKVLDAVSSKKLERAKDLLKYVDLIKVNQFEFASIKDELIHDYIKTMGSSVLAKINGKTYAFHHQTVKAINPTGCGDTFFGAYLSNISHGIESAFTEAVKAATASALTIEAVPEKEEIDKIRDEDLEIVWETK